MVSATESLYGTDAVLSVDPYVDNGIEEMCIRDRRRTYPAAKSRATSASRL